MYSIKEEENMKSSDVAMATQRELSVSEKDNFGHFLC